MLTYFVGEVHITDLASFSLIKPFSGPVVCFVDGFFFFFFFAMALRPNASHGLLILEVSRSHTMTHHIR